MDINNFPGGHSEQGARRAARFVLNRHRNTSSVSDMFAQLQWPSLQDRRRSSRLAMLYKIRNGLACVNCALLEPLPPSARRGHLLQLQRIPCRTDYRNNMFFPNTIRDWNSLPPETAQSPSLAPFV